MHDTIVRLADVWKTCNKIRAAVFRVGLNLWDWYRPLDPGGNSLISESKFVSVLAGPLRPVVGLSDAEIAQLADYFRAQDGRVLYHQLCQLIHGEDAGASGQKSAECQLEACAPPAPDACRALDPWQARRLCCLLATIADRQIPLKPYFQDYELVAKNDGRITFAHFARILSFVGVVLSAEDFQLLVRRFIRDSYTVDYVQFLEALEAVRKDGIRGLGPEYMNPAAVIDTRNLRATETGGQAPRPSTDAPHPALKPPPPQRSLPELMQRVQSLVGERRLRMSEFFRDYDPLNRGVVTHAQFLRGLSAAGLAGPAGAGGALSAAEAACVARHYRHPADPDAVCWRTFDDDCDLPFTTKELEKYPTLVPGGGAATAPAAAAPSEPAEAALQYLRGACRERGLDLRTAFRDHDRYRSGRVSLAEARRALARLGALPRPGLLRAVEERFSDDRGFCYARLLDQLEQGEEESGVPMSGACRPPAAVAADPRETDIVQILAKIRGKVIREGVRPLEFLRQFDKRRELVVPRADFYRALATAGLALTPREMDTLMEVFSAPGRRRFVEYERFAASAGGSGGGGAAAAVERAPLLAPLPPLEPPGAGAGAGADPLPFQERLRTATALDALAKHPDRVSNILEVFKEMDRSRRGCVPQRDVERALARRGLLPLLAPHHLAALCRAFRPRRDAAAGEVDYRALCNALNIVHAAARAQPC